MEFGNLMSYGPDLDELFRQSTKYVDKIVRGTNPSDLPEEFPTRYALISILRFAKALDLTIQGDRITERIAAPHESLNGMARPRPAPNLLGLRLEALRKAQEHAMPTSLKTPETIATIGIDLGKNTFH